MATKAQHAVAAPTHPALANAPAMAGASNMPAHLQRSGPARGSENVQSDDLVIPRLELVQSLSPCIDENDAGYIEGAKAGMLYNNVTRELYGTSVEVVPVFFKKEFIIWKDRKKGGGFAGAYATMELAEEGRAGLEKPDEHQINDTANHFCLMRNPNSGKVEEIVVSMAITKLKVSRQWNSLIRINESDSFTRFYTLSSADDKNGAGEKFKNFAIRNGGWVTADEFDRAEKLYEAVKSGIAVVNRDTEGAPPEASGMRDLNEKTEY